jgi:hypothetical protein
MKALGRVLLFCGLLSVPLICPAQTAQGPANEQESSRDFWILQARLITDDLLKDAAGLRRIDRSLLLGRLAGLWWQDDLDQSRGWMRKAINEVETKPERESKTERRARLAAARSLLAIAASLDKTSGNRLAAMLTSEVETGTDEEFKDNATGLVQAGLDVLEKNPAQAAAFGSASLRVGRSSRLISLLSRLRTRDRGLGDALFIEALTFARTKNDRDLLGSLTLVAFNGPAPSNDIRKRVLGAVSEQFLGPGTAENNGCSLAPALAPLLGEFDRLSLERASIVRNGLILCQHPHDSSSRNEVDRSLPTLKTVDDLMEAAKNASNPNDKVAYLGRAAYLAAQESNFSRAVEILDTFNEDERKELGLTWDNWRWEFASSAAIANLKQGDAALMGKTIASTPAYLRGFVQVSLAEELAGRGDVGEATELLQDARKGFAKLEGSDILDWYLTMLRRYAKLAPQESPVVFAELVRALNKREQPKESSPGKQGDIGFTDSLPPITLPTSLLENDIVDIKDSASRIESSSVRIRVRLGLLMSALDLARMQNRRVDTGNR